MVPTIQSCDGKRQNERKISHGFHQENDNNSI